VKLRLMTANLFSGRADPAALARLVEAIQPDVLAVQELGPAQAAAIAALLPHGRLEPRSDFDGMGIALRHPAPVANVPLRHREARVARLAPGLWPGLDLPLEIVNVHVLAPHAPPPWRTFPIRHSQMSSLLGWLDGNPHGGRIVCGDLNATPLWPAYRLLAARLTDVALAHASASGERPRRTWGPWHGAPRVLRIDHVFASGGRVLDCRTVSVTGSDHDAVLVDMEF
jgi:endonuclease/exonuclease/phosphatase (EEP) superfamily protein YafD